MRIPPPDVDTQTSVFTRSPFSSWMQIPNIRRMLSDSNCFMVSTSLLKIDFTSLDVEKMFDGSEYSRTQRALGA